MKKTACPAHLSKEGKTLWREIIADYAISDPGGLGILRAACEAFDRSQAARLAIDKHGMLLKGTDGAPKVHPLIAAERDARSSFLQALKMLNLDLEPLREKPGRPAGS